MKFQYCKTGSTQVHGYPSQNAWVCLSWYLFWYSRGCKRTHVCRFYERLVETKFFQPLFVHFDRENRTSQENSSKLLISYILVTHLKMLQFSWIKNLNTLSELCFVKILASEHYLLNPSCFYWEIVNLPGHVLECARCSLFFPHLPIFQFWS